LESRCQAHTAIQQPTPRQEPLSQRRGLYGKGRSDESMK
jgi:hypothetical protein